MTDIAKLERLFREYTGSLPDYKRREVYAYVNALKDEIARLDREYKELARHRADRPKETCKCGHDRYVHVAGAGECITCVDNILPEYQCQAFEGVK